MSVVMMDTITIPSPSAFLSSPVIQPAKAPPPPTTKRKSTSTKATNTSPKKQSGVSKPKQSKSRNGCITCKAKRLKCDETKPTCTQCHKRSVTCGGYKKDFKWRPFEEATFTNKIVPSRSKRSTASPPKPPDPENGSPSPSDGSSNPSPDAEPDTSMHDTFFNAAVPSPSMMQMQDVSFSDPQFNPSIPFDMSTPPYLRNTQRRIFDANLVTTSLDSLFEDTSFTPPLSRSISGQSPRLVDLLLPGSPLNAPPSIERADQGILQHASFLYQPGLTDDGLIDPDIEEIVRQTPANPPSPTWVSLPTPLSFQLNSRSSPSSPAMNHIDSFTRLYRQPEVQAGSPEMLMLRFDKQTCGILSVKDGPTENPWRTLIWPLARDSTALYHAIASMTAFHTSHSAPALRVDGMEHMRMSIRSLATGLEGGIGNGGMRTDTALATTLVLAFSESWDQHISTGIEHLRGARILVRQAVQRHERKRLDGEDLARLKFLANTWVYMDVIARLTSSSAEPLDNFATVLAPLFGSDQDQITEIDPLMGCASSLFPLIGRAATLCRKVRTTETNSIAFISQAIELQEAILAWSPGTEFEDPEDPSSEIQHALQTAEAYRFATLLYLHQAVPEIPSLTSAVLAKKVLVFLATVPLSSRLVIVQIYPLLAAGCEVEEVGDREWVLERWQMMEKRMWIGNLGKCADVTREVWRRRDSWESERQISQQREMERKGVNLGIMHSESNRRRLEEESVMASAMGEEFLTFEEMLNGSTLGGTTLGAAGAGAGMTGSSNVGIKRQKQKCGMRNEASQVDKGKKRQSVAGNEMVVDEMDREFTARGSLHWIGVMKDWNWEILLG